ncbi:MAG: hypothetical protein D6B25_01140 [Desulfobulbaceae bacterium]|nr:MAG: hypothetical protein D6B25_01140 [Desulfobulbaceae bacterium]
MPIAHCIVTPELRSTGNSSHNLIALWGDESGISIEHMTVNIIVGNSQFGNRYQVMANLYLPTLWSPSDISSLQTGLAKGLSRYYQIVIESVFIMTQLVESGMVVVAGEELKW